MALTRSQMNALLREYEKLTSKTYLTSVQRAKLRANIKALAQAIETGDIDRIMLASGIREGMYSSFTESIRNAYLESGIFILAADIPKRFAMEFDINNPRAESWLRNNSSQLITGRLMPEQREAIQVMLRDGMIKGKNPRSVALDIVGRMSQVTGRRSGGVIGLTSQQATYVTNMADDLADLNSERYFNRKLRDRRFDNIVQQSMDSGKPLPAAKRQQIVNHYEDRMLKHRGDNIGRTEVLKSLNEASDEAMRQVVEEGLAPRQAVTKIWRHSFGANEREGHIMMDGQRRKLDEYFVNPITGVPLPYPGAGPASEIINCRCWVEHQVDFVAVELAA